MFWTTLRTTSFRWEAELMQQILASHGISSRILDLGVAAYFGGGSAAALQVHPDDRRTASQLLVPMDELDAQD